MGETSPSSPPPLPLNQTRNEDNNKWRTTHPFIRPTDSPWIFATCGPITYQPTNQPFTLLWRGDSLFDLTLLNVLFCYVSMCECVCVHVFVISLFKPASHFIPRHLKSIQGKRFLLRRSILCVVSNSKCCENPAVAIPCFPPPPASLGPMPPMRPTN